MRVYLTLLLVAVYATAAPIVDTNYGKVEGFDYEDAEVFLGIPFAKPPVDELRFERPEAPEPWDGVYAANQFRNDCTPHYRLVAQFSSYSGEDCLTLNVIRPKEKTEKLLPVLFWIHGGGYEIGAASQHGYEVFARKYATQGVIVVTIQYRLGFLGFFTDGTDGNYGLFDQAAALKFVNQNIAQFGGDPDQVTIWGYSAGASSVSQLTLSPYTRDLYSKAIIMSASSFAGWATGPKVADNSKRLAEILGCPWPAAKECMKKKPLSEIFDAVEEQGWTTGTIDILRWSPVIDGDFLPVNPADLVKSAPTKPVLMGLSNKEAAYFTAANMGRVIADFGLSEETLPKVDEEFITEIVGRKVLYENRYGENREKVWKEIINFYLHHGKPEDQKDLNGFYVNQYSEMFSDIVFNVPIVREIMTRVEQKTPVWTYLFEHYNDKIWKKYIPKQVKGSPHANEYHYLFEMPALTEIDITKEPDMSIQNDMINMVVSFTKTGVPKVQDLDWRPVSDPDDINFLRIQTEGASLQNNGLFQESTHFWNTLRDREGFDLVDPTFFSTRSSSHSHDKQEL
uniref:Carboxylic ester hydrolase n=1 Tax=Caenorhabditis japonica TaxID=281687 RepID=A0A8R1DT87_CAEJA